MNDSHSVNDWQRASTIPPVLTQKHSKTLHITVPRRYHKVVVSDMLRAAPLSFSWLAKRMQSAKGLSAFRKTASWRRQQTPVQTHKLLPHPRLAWDLQRWYYELGRTPRGASKICATAEMPSYDEYDTICHDCQKLLQPPKKIWKSSLAGEGQAQMYVIIVMEKHHEELSEDYASW